MENKVINGHTLVFTLSEKNSFENIRITDGVNNIIADFSDVDIDTLNTIKNNLTKFVNLRAKTCRETNDKQEVAQKKE